MDIKLELTRHEANIVGIALDELRDKWIKVMADYARAGVDDKTLYQMVKTLDGTLLRVNNNGGGK